MSKHPSKFMTVDLPDPLGPIIATNSPSDNAEIDSPKRWKRGASLAVDFGHADKLDQRLIRFPGSDLLGPNMIECAVHFAGVTILLMNRIAHLLSGSC